MSKRRGFLNYFLVFCITFLFLSISNYSSIANDDVKKSYMIFYDGNILYVGGSGPSNYTKIQDAIDNASNGDTVFVYDDSSPYNESFYVDKSIKVLGENMTTTIINGVTRIISNNVTIAGFMFMDYGIPAMNIEGFSNNIIENCIFNGSWGGLYIEKSNNNIIRNCSFKFCMFGALKISFSENNEISYCDFFDCNDWMMGRPSITIGFSRGIRINHCNIARNHNGGVAIDVSSVKFNFNNIISNYGNGLVLGPVSSCDLKYNWWGSSEGPNVTINARFWRQYHLRIVDNGESVFIGSMTMVRELFSAIRLLPWLSQPVSNAGQHPN